MIKEKWCLICMSNANIKYRALTRIKKKDWGETHHVTHDTQTKVIVILTIKYKVEWIKMNNMVQFLVCCLKESPHIIVRTK